MTYHVTTSDGAMHHIAGTSASEAIGKALDRFRGLTVTGCFTGNIMMEVLNAGRITYDVPAHSAIPPEQDQKILGK